MQIEAPIDRVRVHHQGATITRRITLEAPPPAITLIGLPLCLEDGTVRARIVDQQGARAVASGVTLHVRPPDAVDAPAEAELREAARTLERIERDLQVLREARGLFAQIPVLPRGEAIAGQAPQPSPFAARVAQGRFVSEVLGDRDARIAALEAAERAAREAVVAAQAALEAASTARSARAAPITKAVTLTLKGAADGPLTVELDYRVPGARWAPQYQIRLAGDGGAAEVVLRAAVIQATGEDWRGVQLELSTASPQRIASRPTLMALRIGEAQAPPPAPTLRPPPRGAEALFAAYDAARRRAPATGVAWSAPQVAQGAPPAAPALHLAEVAVRSEAHVGAAFGGIGATTGAAMDDYAAQELAMPPPMPASPPPMPAGPMSRSASAPAPARSLARSAPAPMAKKREARLDDDADEAAAALAGPPTDYANLQLAAPGAADRGRLTRADDLARYVEGLRASGRVVDADVAALVGAASRRALAVGGLPAGAADVRQAAGNHDYLYRADARIDVAGDGAWHTVPLGVRSAACRTRYVVVPRVDAGVFRVATLQNPLAAPLLPGEAEVYVDGEYVLATAVPFVAGEAEIELGLGVEQRLRCARNTRFEEQRSAEAVVAMTDLVHHIEIRLRNGLGRVADCEVRERIPQPAADAEVVVEERAVAPAWAPYPQTDRGRRLRGGRRWRVEVPAGAEVVLSAEYAVRIYAKNALVGGNRREG